MTPSDKFKDTIEKIRHIFKKEKTPMPNLLVLGDFNFPFIKYERKWRNTYTQMNGTATKEEKEQAKILFSLMDELALTQELSEGTR